ncbi:MAG TPA: glycosyltransferase family 2 protein [Burkholderiales bacterium]|nr:glycosyltransferase family 2 protein [Burkholderiales bacterium]
MSLSVIIICSNNEGTIRRCLESVAWADEIVVVESGSADRTVEISREFTAHVHQTPDFPGYGPQKNRALELATGDWVFSLDSDEWVTPELRAEIEGAVATPRDNDSFMVPRRSSFCGRFMRHSGWWPDYVRRLFRRGTARFSDDQGHDRLIVTGATGRLSSPLLHETVTSLDQVIDKMNVYSAMTARSLHQKGRRASIVTALLHGAWAFFRTYFVRAGFLDGREGFMLAVINAENSYYRYAKLMLLGEKSVKGDE